MQPRSSPHASLFVRFGAVLSALSLLCLPVSAADICPPQGGIEAVVDSAISGDTLRLADGRLVRLAGITVPEAASSDARGFLARKLSGATLRLHPLSPEPDRYGRQIARVTLAYGDSEPWLEKALVAAGLALATLNPGEAQCFASLLAAESQARRHKTGYWAVDRGMALQASSREAVLAAIGRFAVYEGKIIRVAVRDYAIFLDFGEDWRRDLSIILLRRERAAVEKALGPMQALIGRTIQIRGIVESRPALRLRLTRPEQLRVIED